MHISEYWQVKDYTYLEYCDYLQQKYGIGVDDYMTPRYNRKNKCSRTKDGLLVHHKREDTAVMLASPYVAPSHPYEWQLKEHLVYCDYLEHLLLHTLICKYPSPNKQKDVHVGIGGVVNFIVPELNDVYSGWLTKLAWQKTCHEKIINDCDVYYAILRQFVEIEKDDPFFVPGKLCRSYNAVYGIWSDEQNEKIYHEIRNIISEITAPLT